jgi:hypothetical protein
VRQLHFRKLNESSEAASERAKTEAAR